MGGIPFAAHTKLWKSWAPLKTKIFIWLAIWNCCWTADRLSRRGLQQPQCCPLCDQEPENIQHILVTCVFSREIWFHTLRWIGHEDVTPSTTEISFNDWWACAARRVPRERRKGFNILVILVAWELWKMRNRCVFDHASPQVPVLLHLIREEDKLWEMAGARKLRQIL